MSAIWGAVSLSGRKLSSQLAKDFEKEYIKKTKLDNYHYKHTSSAIIGRGLQYITAEDLYDKKCIYDETEGIIFVTDCILDNRNELTELLSITAQISDNEIMYLAYKKYGLDCVKHFLGTYAIAIWNEFSHELILISDHVASRSLYYTRIDDVVYFSTILSPITKWIKNTDINWLYIKDFLLSDHSHIYTVPGETHVKDVYVMRPARTVSFSLSNTTENIYWKPESSNTVSASGSDKEVLDNFMKIYNACVKDCLRTSGNIGITLSGGLDSSSIAASASQNLKEKLLFGYTYIPALKTSQPLPSYAVTDESDLVNNIVNMYPNIKPHFLTNEGKNDFEDIETILDIFEMPYKTAPFASHLEICKKANADGCKVILVGEYGNTSVSFGELENILYNFYVNKDSTSIIKYASRFCEHEQFNTQEYLLQKLNSFRSFESFLTSGASVYDNFIPDNVFISPQILKNYNLVERMSCDKRATLSKGYITSEQYKEFLTGESLQIYLGIFKTKFGLYSGTILRDPTMDKRIIEFCYNLPFGYFANNGVNRFLIREGFKNLLPESIIDRWRQKGFQSSDWTDKIIRDWKSLKPQLLEIIANAPNELILVDEVRKFIEEFDYSKPVNSTRLNSLFEVINVTILLESFTYD